MTITPDGKYMATGSEDCSIKIFDLETKKEVHHWTDNKAGILRKLRTEITFLGKVKSLKTYANRFLIAGYEYRSIKIFDMETKELIHYDPVAHRGIQDFTRT